MNRYASLNALTVLAIGVGAFAAGCKSSGSTAAAAPTTTGHGAEAAKISSKQAQQNLIEGNARFVAGHGQHARQDGNRRTELATSQHPFAIVLGCADSRTSPEILFDQGLGDLFIIREAGNVIDDHTIGSIEYGAEHLHSPLIVVLGHERCGAIAAARDTIAAKGHAEGHIESIVESIRPAVEATMGLDAEATCRANIQNMVQALKNSQPLLQHMLEKGEIAIVAAYYDLDSGAVTFLSNP